MTPQDVLTLLQAKLGTGNEIDADEGRPWIELVESGSEYWRLLIFLPNQDSIDLYPADPHFQLTLIPGEVDKL